MVVLYLEPCTKASQTNQENDRSISFSSTAPPQTPTSSESSSIVQNLRGSIDNHFEMGQFRPGDDQPEETSGGEFAFLEVTPDDFTILHPVTSTDLVWRHPVAASAEFLAPPREEVSSPQIQEPIETEGKADHSSTPLQHASSFHEGLGKDDLPVKSTFIHFGSAEEAQREWTSCPGMIMTKEFHTKYPAMERAHIQGECQPCAYFVHKGDGCRWGEGCRFCHLCPPGALKKKKKEKVKALKERDYFLKMAVMQRNVAT